MHTLTVWTAEYLLFAMAAVAAAVWLFVDDGPAKVQLIASALVGALLLVGMLYLARFHHDPRPFMRNPQIKPLFPASRDDGFPSDHALAAGFIAALIGYRHRLVGIALAIAAALIAWARVAAHVHHLQDVVAGLAIGAVAALLGALVVSAFLSFRSARAASVSAA